MDRSRQEYDEYCHSMPWWCTPFQSPYVKSLAREYNVQGIPHVVVIDSGGCVLVPDATEIIKNDHTGENFPWRPTPFPKILPASYISSDKYTFRSVSELDDKYLLLYFSAKWCAPCKQFSPKLNAAYDELQRHRSDVEVCFLVHMNDKTFCSQLVCFSSFSSAPTTMKHLFKNISRLSQALLFHTRTAKPRDYCASVYKFILCPLW